MLNGISIRRFRMHCIGIHRINIEGLFGELKSGSGLPLGVGPRYHRQTAPVDPGCPIRLAHSQERLNATNGGTVH